MLCRVRYGQSVISGICEDSSLTGERMIEGFSGISSAELNMSSTPCKKAVGAGKAVASRIIGSGKRLAALLPRWASVNWQPL